MTTLVELTASLVALGVRQGGVLLVHTSFRAVSPRTNPLIDGGPLTLIAALRAALGHDGTLVMPTMTSGETLFDPRTTPTDGMGITAELFWQQPGVVRSTHPGGSFAAVGPAAEDICRPQPLSPPHGLDSPVGRVYEHDGQVLLLGVGHSENTTLHLAESLAPVPYSVAHPCVVGVDDHGALVTMAIAETDHCCRGFAEADAWLRARSLQREGTVGAAHARLVASRAIVEIAVAKLRADPLRFLCTSGDGCDECDAARASISPLHAG